MDYMNFTEIAEEKAKKSLEYSKILSLLASHATLEGAKEIIENLTFEKGIKKVKRLLAETGEAKDLIEKKGFPSFYGITDIKETLKRADKGALLTPFELMNICNVFVSAKSLKSYGEKESNILQEKFAMLIYDKSYDDKIKKTFAPDLTVLDSASDKLFDIRRKIRAANSKVRESLQKYITSPSYTKYLQDNIITQRNSRFVLAVKAENKNEIKGLVHDTSASGSTVFIEPANVVTLNNEIKVLENDEKNEIERILYELSAMASTKSEVLTLNYEIILSLNVIFARGDFAITEDCTLPEVSEDGEISLIKARHPLIDKEKAVPISISVGNGYDTLVITGPNTGGKTVSLKTVGLFSMMAQTGLYLPCAEGSKVRIFTNILADIGDEQSIEQSLSTFSAHMVNIISITKLTSPSSLVLYDELGAGTDPVEGAALAIAILEFTRAAGALCVATTHYAELKAYALETPGVINGACEFDIETLKPTYRLIIGAPGRSNAFLISEKLGLDRDIIASARNRVTTENAEFEKVIEKLENSRVEAEKSREEADRIKRELKQKLETAEAEREKLLESAKNELEKAKNEATRLIRSAKSSSDYVFGELDRIKKAKDKEFYREEYEKAKSSLRDALKKGEKDTNIKIEIEEEENELPRDLVPGDIVVITYLNKEGVVEKIAGNTITVRADKMTAKCDIKDLRLVTDIKKATEKKVQKGTKYSPRPDVKAEIDLRGMTGDDAWFMVDKYLDDAKRANLSSVRLIHGKGTGALRQALWRFLKSDKRVENYRVGAYGEGDFGVTVVDIK